MANIIIQGKTYNNVPAVNFDKVGGGIATYTENGGSAITIVPLSATQNGTYNAPADTAYNPVTVNVSSTPTLQSKTVNPSTSQQTVSPDSGYDGLSSVTVNAIPSGTAGTPVATKGNVLNNHSIKVTPSVTNTTGYITGGTLSGTAVTVSASELVSGTITITSSGTTDVTNYASASVAAGSATTPYTEVEVSPAVFVNANGFISAQVQHTESFAPTVVAGYVSSGTSGNVVIEGAGSYQLPTQSATTITPSTTSQTAVSAGKFTTGAITVDPIPSQYIVPTGTVSITSNGTVDVTQYASADVLIPATSTSYLGTNPVKIADYATQTVALSSTSFATWTPSTTYTTIYASSNVGTAVLDLVNYNYNIVWFFDIEYKYDGTESSASKALRTCQSLLQAIYKIPNNMTNLQSQNFNGNYCTTLFTAGLIDYYNTSSVKKLTYTSSVAAYLYATAATFSNSTTNTPTLTVKTPSIRFVCNNSYLTTANCAKIDKANTKFTLRGELWRVDKDSAMQGMYRNIVEMYNS